MQRYKLEIRNVDIKSIFDFQSKKDSYIKNYMRVKSMLKIRTWEGQKKIGCLTTTNPS